MTRATALTFRAISSPLLSSPRRQPASTSPHQYTTRHRPMSRPLPLRLCLFLPSLLLLLSSPTPLLPAAADFLLNGFDPASLTLYGDAAVETGQYRSLSLTNSSTFSIGRALYKTKVAARAPADSSSSSSAARRVLPFHASFIFSIAPIRGTLPGHGIAFLFSPSPGIQGATAAQHMGLFNRSTDGNRTNGVLAVEFDVFQNEEFSDIDANHVGVDLYSLTSIVSYPAGYWPDGAASSSSSSSSSFVGLKLNDGSNYQAWVDYVDGQLNVTMAPVALGKKPSRPLITKDLDLSDVFLDEMYVGFCAATGKLVERHRILGWSFSNDNSSFSEGLITSNLPNFIPSKEGSKLGKGIVAGITAATVAVFVISSVSLYAFWRHRRRKKREETGGPRGDGEGGEVLEDWESEYWPHRIGYRDISAATDAFSDRNLIGSGGNGRVYKGFMGGSQVAVKLFLRNTGEEARQFLAEVSSLGRLKHRNLVGLRGWCRRKEGGALVLVYNYMENGSLDKWLFPAGDSAVMNWETRVRILRDVAAGVLYLHEGWEARVLHRDIKASNVMLDGAMNGRLGDFGLARMQPHGRGLCTSRVVGSVGYMAPEVVRSGRASAATDVYGFGVLLLEAVCGRRPVEEGRPPLVEWVRTLAERGELPEAVDPRLSRGGGAAVDEGEAVRLLDLGLMCTCVDPASRPTMRQVAGALEGGPPPTKGGEAAEAWLLDRKLRESDAMAPTTSAWMWSKKQRGRWGAAAQSRHHVTFEELRQSMSCSTSLSASDIIVDGR